MIRDLSQKLGAKIPRSNPHERTQKILSAVVKWAKTQESVRGVAVVGSWARDAARADSDLDLVFLATDPNRFRGLAAWLEEMDWQGIGETVSDYDDEQYGALWSRRVRLEDGFEVEFGFAPCSWASFDPIDSGTRRVVEDGCQILYDPEERLARLCAAVARFGPPVGEERNWEAESG